MTRVISPVGGGFAGLDCGARTFVADTRNSINTRTLILGTFFLFVFSLSLSHQISFIDSELGHFLIGRLVFLVLKYFQISKLADFR